MVKYSDIISYVIFIFLIPFVAIKFLLFLLPSSLLIIFSSIFCDRCSSCIFLTILALSYVINKGESFLIYFLSFIFYPYGLVNYYYNRNVITFLRDNVKRNHFRSDAIAVNLRNAIEKEGRCEVLMKFNVMLSFLPTYRHCFLNNSILFRYSLRLTNQVSESFENKEMMCDILFSYVTNPEYIKNLGKEAELDDIGFTPNYFNDLYDKIEDYDNLGLQVAPMYTTFIYLESLHKTSNDLYNYVDEAESDISIMNETHNIYQEIEDRNIELIHHKEFDELHHMIFLDLVVTYDDMYHVVTGKVEAGINNHRNIEHPMLCLYHQGRVMKFVWEFIDNIFNHQVMKRLKELENISKNK